MRQIVMILMMAALIGSVSAGSGRAAPMTVGHPLTLIPTALEELNELRMNTGHKAILRDGTMNAAYQKRIPSPGSIYLNFHVDVSSDAGPVMLHRGQIRLEGPAAPAETLRAAFVKEHLATETPGTVSYTPMDWFIDTGMAEARGDSLKVDTKAIVQFTIEVPRAGFDELALFVGSQRVGTVSEIRQRIFRYRGVD
jgi:hypothetical protein